MGITDGVERFLSKFDRFEKSLNGQSGSSIHQIRRAAIARFAEIGFPDARTDEDWNYTNVAPLTGIEFNPVTEHRPGKIAPGDLGPYGFPGVETQMVFVDGHFAPELSSRPRLPKGVRATTLAEGLKEFPRLLEAHLGRHASYRDHSFVALNTAFILDGAFLHIPEGTVLAEPVHLLFLTASRGSATVSYPRSLILAEPGSKATVIESYAGPEEGQYLTSATTEIVLMEDVVLDHYRIQREGRGAFHFATTQVQESRGCNFTSNSVSLGGGLVRNEVNTVLGGEGVESTLNGLYVVDGAQHVDNHTLIEHASPRCTSHEFYKGTLDGRSTGAFRGKILVRKDAQKTDAYQSNRNLLLSDEASVNAQPQLEIYADDVKCSHGATIGQLDENAIFYLRARGMGLEPARQVLIRAFANEVLDRVRPEPVRTRLEGLVFEKLRAGRKARGVG